MWLFSSDWFICLVLNLVFKCFKMCICSWSVDEDTVLLFHWNLNVRCVCFGQILKRVSSGSSTKWPTAPESRSTRRVSSSGHWWMDWLIDRCVGCSLMVCVCVWMQERCCSISRVCCTVARWSTSVMSSALWVIIWRLCSCWLRSWRRRSEPCWRVSPTIPQTHRWVSALIFESLYSVEDKRRCFEECL